MCMALPQPVRWLHDAFVTADLSDSGLPAVGYVNASAPLAGIPTGTAQPARRVPTPPASATTLRRVQAFPMRLVSPDRYCADCIDALMMAGLPEWWGARHPERMGNAPTSTFAPPPGPPRRLRRRRWPAAAPRPAGQTAGLRRPWQLCLHALLDDGWSIPQLAVHLACTQAAIRCAITDYHVQQPPRRQQLARQRRRAAQQRAIARAAEVGLPSMRAYLVDRLVTQAWTLARVRAPHGTITVGGRPCDRMLTTPLRGVCLLWDRRCCRSAPTVRSSPAVQLSTSCAWQQGSRCHGVRISPGARICRPGLPGAPVSER